MGTRETLRLGLLPRAMCGTHLSRHLKHCSVLFYIGYAIEIFQLKFYQIAQ